MLKIIKKVNNTEKLIALGAKKINIGEPIRVSTYDSFQSYEEFELTEDGSKKEPKEDSQVYLGNTFSKKLRKEIKNENSEVIKSYNALISEKTTIISGKTDMIVLAKASYRQSGFGIKYKKVFIVGEPTINKKMMKEIRAFIA